MLLHGAAVIHILCSPLTCRVLVIHLLPVKTASPILGLGLYRPVLLFRLWSSVLLLGLGWLPVLTSIFLPVAIVIPVNISFAVGIDIVLLTGCSVGFPCIPG